MTQFVLSAGLAVSTVRYEGRDFNLWEPGPRRYVWQGRELVLASQGPYAIPDVSMVPSLVDDVQALVQCVLVGDEKLHDWAVEHLISKLYPMIASLDVDDAKHFRVMTIPKRSPAAFQKWMRHTRGIDIFLCFSHALNK